MTKLWNKLPKTVKVFFYLALSTVLAEVLVELKLVEQTILVRLLAQIVNLVIVFLQESIPAVKARFTKE
jgi:hypothetical protein